MVWACWLNKLPSLLPVLVQNQVKAPFLKALQAEIEKRYPDPLQNDSYPCIINRKSYDRLVRLIETEDRVIGGQADLEKHKIAPAIFPEADPDHEIMKREIWSITAGHRI